MNIKEAIATLHQEKWICCQEKFLEALELLAEHPEVWDSTIKNIYDEIDLYDEIESIR